VAFGVWVGVGSRDEIPSLHGSSHFLEHLLFKGTKRRTAHEISSALDAVGGEMNAFTAKEYTCYYARVLDTDLPLAIDVISDLYTSSLITAADVESERGVILEEIAMHDDDPTDAVHDVFADQLFGDTPLGRPIAGTVASIEALRRPAISGYYRRRYRPENTVVAVAGNSRHTPPSVRQVRKGVQRGRLPRRRRPPLPARTGSTLAPRAGVSPARPAAYRAATSVLGVPAVARSGRAPVALGVLNAALGRRHELAAVPGGAREARLAYSVYSYTAQYATPACSASTPGCLPKKVDDVLALCREELEKVAAGGLSGEELRAARASSRARSCSGLEDTGSRMSRIAKASSSTGAALGRHRPRAHRRGDSRRRAGRGGAAARCSEEPRVIGPFEESRDFTPAVA
jgi:predicted Zn-dependent peptidase